jgi:hypothetical protein
LLKPGFSKTVFGKPPVFAKTGSLPKTVLLKPGFNPLGYGLLEADL